MLNDLGLEPERLAWDAGVNGNQPASPEDGSG
jgi:hypothetical protein